MRSRKWGRRDSRMTRQRLPMRKGDVFRAPAKPSAKWHRVIACRRRKDGTVYVCVKRLRFWRLLGLGPVQRIEHAYLAQVGYEVKP